MRPVKFSVSYMGAMATLDFESSTIDPHDFAQLSLSTLEKIMSAVTPDLQEIKTKLATLKANNDDLTADNVDAHAKLNAANAALTIAQANAIDPADLQLISEIKALVA